MKISLVLMLIIMLFSGCTQAGNLPPGIEKTAVTGRGEDSGAALRLSELNDDETMEVEVTLAEASTPLLDDSPSRVENINIACGAINGIAVYPGGTFSFNDTVGRRTAERGYEDAPVIVDGHKEQGCGGGVCQVSSTLYMAAVKAGLTIDERHPHSHSVAYAPKGMDATVVSGEKDLKITNSTDGVVTLYIWTDGVKVFSKITQKKLDKSAW